MVVADGHGRYGHLVASEICKVLPNMLVKAVGFWCGLLRCSWLSRLEGKGAKQCFCLCLCRSVFVFARARGRVSVFASVRVPHACVRACACVHANLYIYLSKDI